MILVQGRFIQTTLCSSWSHDGARTPGRMQGVNINILMLYKKIHTFALFLARPGAPCKLSQRDSTMMRFLCILLVLLGAANSSAFVLPPTSVIQKLEQQDQTALFLSSPNYKHVMTAALFVSLWLVPFDASIAATLPQAQNPSLSSTITLATPDVIVKPFGGGIGGFGISPFGVGPFGGFGK